MDTENNRPLWAPWRIELIRGPKPECCFLCEKGIKKSEEEDIHEHVIAYGDTCYLLMNGFPYSAGHLMIAPYRHVADLRDLSPEERAETMEMAVKAQDIISDVMNPDGFNIGYNIGAAAGAGTAAHLHMHIVPRWNGDHNFMPVIGKQHIISEALEETTKLLKDAWNRRFEES